MGYETWIATPSLKRAIWVGKRLCAPRHDLAAIRAYYRTTPHFRHLHPEDPRPRRIRAWLDEFGREDTRGGGDSDCSDWLFRCRPGDGEGLQPGWALYDAWGGVNVCPYCSLAECADWCSTRTAPGLWSELASMMERLEAANRTAPHVEAHRDRFGL